MKVLPKPWRREASKMAEESLDIIIRARDMASDQIANVVNSLKGLGDVNVTIAATQAHVSSSFHSLGSVLRSFGRDVGIASHTFVMLTKELGISVPVINQVIGAVGVLASVFRMVGAIMHAYELITKSATIATIAQTLAQHGLNTALAITVGLLTAGIGLLATGFGLAAYRALVPSMQSGGFVPREGIYYLHPGELVVPKERIETLREREKITILQPQIVTPALQVPKPEATILKPEIVVPSPTIITRGGSTYQTINVYFENRAPVSGEVDAQNILRDLGNVVAEKARRGGYR